MMGRLQERERSKTSELVADFHDSVPPVLEFFRESGLLVSIYGGQSVDEMVQILEVYFADGSRGRIDILKIFSEIAVCFFGSAAVCLSVSLVVWLCLMVFQQFNIFLALCLCLCVSLSVGVCVFAG